MKKTTLLIALLAVVLASGCDKEEKKSSVALNFKGDFGTEALVMFADEYPYYEGMNVKFQLFQFYLSDVVLLKEAREDAEAVELFDVELITFKDIQTAAAAGEGITITSREIPAGEYKGIRFGIGVAPDFNATSPGDYRTDHPLSDNYWSWALGYIFTKIEGNADLDGDGEYTNDGKLTFHIGANELYRESVVFQDIVVPENGTLKLQFKVDLKRVLSTGAANFVDFRQVTQDHTNNMELARFISDNLKAAITLE
jgi:hypothetical protein